MLVAVIVLGFSVIVANLYASWLVFNEDIYESRQKACQIGLIWLVPVVGALVFGGLILTERRNDKVKYQNNNYNATEFDADFPSDISHSSDSD